MPPANNGPTRHRFTSTFLAVILLASGSAQPFATHAQTQQQQAAPPSAAAPKQNSGTVTCSINAQTAPPLSAPLAAARDLYRTGKFDLAIAAYNAIIPTGGDDAAAAYAGLARAFLAQKRVSDAEAAAAKAVALTPNRAPAIVAQGEVLFRQGKLAEAEKAFLTPLRACNLDARAYLGLERLYLATLDFKTADKYIRQAYRLDPGDPDVRREYLYMLDGQERIDFVKKYLADQTNDDAGTRHEMETLLKVLEAEKAEGSHDCKLVNNVKETETKMEMLHEDAQNLRGLGLVVKVNGASGTLKVDTGASGIVIDQKTAEKAGVKHIFDHAVEGIGDTGGSPGYLGYADKIQIGALEFQGCYIEVVNKRIDEDDNGLIGADVFRDYLVDLNMPDRKIKLTQLPPFPDEAAPAAAGLSTSTKSNRVLHNRYAPPEFKDFTPIMLFGHDMLIQTWAENSGPFLFLIDTGSQDTMLDLGLAKQVSKVDLATDVTVRGLSGKVQKVYHTSRVTLRFAGFTQRRDDLTVIDLTSLSDDSGTQISGLLGFTLFNMLDIKIDYRDGLVNFNYDPNRLH